MGFREGVLSEGVCIELIGLHWTSSTVILCPVKLSISPRRITLLLTLTVLFLFFVNFVPALLWMAGWQFGPKMVPLKNFASPLFFPASDTSIPTWYSSVALLLCSILLATIAATRKLHGERYALHWAGLSIIFLLLSIDEVARLHETVGAAVGKFLIESAGFSPTGFLHYTWIVAGAISALVVLLTYLGFLFHLPRRTFNLFLLSGVVFCAGALGFELLELQLTAASFESGRYMWEDMSVATQRRLIIQGSIEDGLEMMGVVIFVYALLSYMGSCVDEITIKIGTKGE